jgi:phosphatidylglycerol:prolipoprotein diacylglycerol transferase
VAAIVGAKVLLVIEDWRYYAAQPSAIFSRDLFQAAGVFYGGFLAALGVAAWYMRRHGLPFLATADAFVPGVALGHSIGRLGCFFAGCCWGKPTSASWAVVFRDPYAHRMFGVPLDTPLHPAQLYESGAVLLLFLVLLAAYQRHRFPGQVLALYLMLYGGVRFVLEFTRDRAGFSLSQGIALALVVAGVALGKVARRRWPALGR